MISTWCCCIFPEPHSKSVAQTPKCQRRTSGSESQGFVLAFPFRGAGAVSKLSKVKSCCCHADVVAVLGIFFLKLLSGKSHRPRISRSFVKFPLLIYGIYTKGVETTQAPADSLPPGRAADLRNAPTEVQGTELPSVPRRTSWTLNSASSKNSFSMCPAALQAPVCLKCHFLL